MTIAAKPILSSHIIAYAQPTKISAGRITLGLASIIIGAIATVWISVGEMYFNQVFAGAVAIFSPDAGWLTWYYGVFLGVSFVGWALCLQAQVVLLFAGVAALRGSDTMVARHRLYARLQVYGMLAIAWCMAIELCHIYLIGSPLTWSLLYGVLGGASLVLVAGGRLVLGLAYPAIILGLPLLRPRG